MKPVNFDDYTNNYNSLIAEQTRFFSTNDQYFARYKIDIIKQHIQIPTQRILEYGCGIGRNIVFLQEAFPDADLVGADVSEASLEVARQTFPHIGFLHTDQLPEDASFDLIVVAGVFHHICLADRQTVIKKLFQHLTKNGSLFIFEHNPFNPITRRIVNHCPFDADAILLTRRELMKRLKKENFFISEQAYCLFIPPKFRKLLSFEKWLNWLPLGGQYWVRATRR